MNCRLIFAFVFFGTYEAVFSVEYKSECVIRKSGACRVLNITEDFDAFIPLEDFKDESYTEKLIRMSTIIEIDYYQNKLNYHHNQTDKQKELDIVDNPVVEILFSEDDNPRYSYRLVLGAKLNRLAYIETAELKRVIKHNNYSPDLPSWPFAINVTVDMPKDFTYTSDLNVYTRNGDGFDREEPFLHGSSRWIEVNYMSIRNRNKNFKLVGFYGCSTKYGSKCGTEVTQTIKDCRAKFSPVGNGFFQNFVNISKFNVLEKQKNNYDQIFGIYRRRNDNMHLIFTRRQFETGAYIRITIGDDEISIHSRTYNETSEKYHDKKAVRKGWTRREPSEPNFIRVIISSVSNNISIHDHMDNSIGPLILTMKLCSYFDSDSIEFMSVTSDGFKTVDLYYDCCVPSELEYCHAYEKDSNRTNSSSAATTDSHENLTVSSTIRLDEEYTTLEPTQTDATTMPTENISSTKMESAGTTRSHENISDSPTTRLDEETEGTTMLNENISSIMESSGTVTETIETDDDDSYDAFLNFLIGRRGHDEVELNEVETFESGKTKTNTFLDTSQFEETGSTHYEYEDGTSPEDYCPHELSGVQLMQITTEATDEVDEDEDDVKPISYTGNNRGGLNSALLARLIG